jgi:hypothetical protein
MMASARIQLRDVSVWESKSPPKKSGLEVTKDWWFAKLTKYFNSLNPYALFKAYELQLWAKAFPKEFGT